MNERLVVDVRLSWCGDAIAVKRFAPGQIARLGDGPGCLAPVPCGTQGDWPIARVDGRTARVVVPPKAAAVVERGGGATERFGALAAVTLGAGDRARVVFGDFEVDVSPTWEEVAEAKGKRALAFAPMAHLALAAGAHGLVILAGARAAAAHEVDAGATQATALQQVLVRADVRAGAATPILSLVERGEGGTGQRQDDQAGDGRRGGGERAAGATGRMGDPAAQRSLGRYAVPGEAKKGPRPTRGAAPKAAPLATQLGVEGPAIASIGAGDADGRGADKLAAEGRMRAVFAGSSLGDGGLGLSGVGEGSGGLGEGVGLGSVGDLGHTAGIVGDGTGGEGSAFESFGSGGFRSSSHRTRGPICRFGGAMTVSGRIPPEVIRRIVRQNFGRFRACYQEGLVANPALAGRVTTRFAVGPDGSVVATRDGGSSMPDAPVTACVVGAFRGLGFPRDPGGGVVEVTYPIVFSPE